MGIAVVGGTVTLPPLNPGDIVRSKYTIVELLNSGCFGSVYKALNILSAKEVALKEIIVKDVTNFSDIIESRSQSLCGHPNVVEFHSGDLDQRNGLDVLYIEMEFIVGGSLSDHLKSRFISIFESTKYIKDILFALEKAHSVKIIHRDVKPANIMIAQNGAKLSDFGVAYDGKLNREVVFGKWYRPHGSPEALQSNIFSPQSDVYCAGLAYHRACNQIASIFPYLSPDPTAFWTAAKQGTLLKFFSTKEWIPKRVHRIISISCQLDLIKRYKSASEFRNQLEKLQFANDWVRETPTLWTTSGLFGSINKIILSEKISGECRVDFHVGLRRRLSDCQSFPNRQDAEKFMLDKISSTTLK